MLRFFVVVILLAALPVLAADESATKPAPKPVAARACVPNQAALDAAEKQVRDVFGEELSHAKTAEQDLALASKLAQTGNDTTDNPAARYVLLCLASHRMAAAGRVDSALKLVDRIGESYDVDVLTMKAELVDYLADLLTTKKRKLAEGENLPETIATLVDEAVAEDQYAVAKKLVDLAVSGARRARNSQLAREFTERNAEIEKLLSEFANVSPSVRRLATNPADADANLAVGSWHCFRKGNWPRGLPLLALANNPALADLAKCELKLTGVLAVRAPKATATKEPKDKELLAVADAWAELAKTKPEPLKTEIRSHAASCIHLALPNLTGLDKAAAETRLRDLGENSMDAEASRSTRRGTVQKGNVALASNGTKVTGKIEHGSELLDGNSTNYDANRGFAYSPLPCEWTITFKQVYLLREVRFLLWDRDPRQFYRYVLSVSVDGRNFVPLVDRSQGEWKSWQTLRFNPRPVKAIRLAGLFSNNEPNLHVVEFEAYCVPSIRRPS